SELAHEALVYGPAKLVRRRRGQPEVFCQDAMMACHQANALVVCGKQHPTLQALAAGKAEKETDALRFICTPPSQAPASVAGEPSQKLIVVFQHPDRDAAAAQTAHDPEAAVVGSHDNRTHWLSRH